MERDERKILRDSMMYADFVRVLWGVVQLQRLGGAPTRPSFQSDQVGGGLAWAERNVGFEREEDSSTERPKSLLVFQSVDLIEL